MSRAYLNKEPHEVAAMFDAVAKKYDFTNDVLSLGQTRAWRKAVVAAIAPLTGEDILDLAAELVPVPNRFIWQERIQQHVILVLACSKLVGSNIRT